MKKINVLMFLLFLTMILLLGCGEENTTVIITTNNVTTEEISTTNKVWETILNQEYFAFNEWAGEGLFFYEEESIKYCDYMLFGSGMPVVGLFKSEVIFIEENQLMISIPNWIVRDQDNTINDVYSIEWMEIILVYEDDGFSGNDLTFKDMGSDLREQAMSMGYLD